MEKENTAQNPKSAAAGAEARRETAAAANLGKFKSVDALLNAYNSLEAEFTRRSQALRELEERKRVPTANLPKKSKESPRNTSPRGKRRCGKPRRRGRAHKGTLRRPCSRRAAAFPPRPRRACARSRRRANSRRICSAKTDKVQKNPQRAVKNRTRKEINISLW